MALTYCGEGQWTPDPGRRFRCVELSPGRDSARTVRARDRFMVCGAAHRTVRFQDMAAVNKSASLRDARRDVVAQADGLRLAARHHGVRGAAVGRRLPSEREPCDDAPETRTHEWPARVLATIKKTQLVKILCAW